MSFSEADGDLFDLGFPAVGHGCNCAGRMGAGIAAEFARRYPAMYQAYADQCAAHGSSLMGSVFFWEEPGLLICNMMTQVSPGPCASLSAIQQAVTLSLNECAKRGIGTLGVPQIGAGIGGLAWEDVKKVMRTAAHQHAVTLVAVTFKRC